MRSMLPHTHFLRRIVSSNIVLILAFTVMVSARLSATTTSAAADCTLYASPSGSSSNSGTSPNSPLSLKAAASRTQPGSVVCLLSGTYYVDTPFEIPRSGNSSSWIIYKSYNGGATIAPRSGSYALIQIIDPVRYIEINGLDFEGQNTASSGIDCKGCDHLRVIGNRINNGGSGGIFAYTDATTGKHADYITADHNQIYHCGYNQGWGSGISYNKHIGYDQYQGFHSFVTNNIISGVYDGSIHHSDGNGIIMDNDAGANTPPVLIANNVVYETGGRCIHSRYSTHIWIVNNTCYKNGIDLTIPPLPGSNSGNDGDFTIYGSSGDYLVNNIAYSWNNRIPYSDIRGTTSAYNTNIWYTSGTGSNLIPSSVESNSNKLKHADPAFVNPPYVNPTKDGQYNTAVPPSQITSQFHLQSGSPAIGAGIDPTTILGVSSNIISGLQAYVFTDINGNPRPHGSAFDLGAYQSSGSTLSITLHPVADSYVDSANPNTNHGSTSPLLVKSIAISYLRFDLLPVLGKTVSSATLRLWVYDGSTGTHNLKSVSDTSWMEAGITYINRPSLGSIINSVSNPKGGTWIEMDVTTQVKALAGQLISFGMDTNSADGLRFDSREVQWNKPQLLIKYY